MYSVEYDLVLHVIGYYYGHLVSKISNYIILHGPITLTKLVNCTPYNFRLIRNVLILLIQHQIVDYKLESTSEENNLVNVLYYISTHKVLSLLLIPFGLAKAQGSLDEDTYTVLLTIAKFGTASTKKIKLTLPQIPPHTIDGHVIKLVNLSLIAPHESFDTQKLRCRNATYEPEPRVDVLENLRNDRFISSSGTPLTSSEKQLYRINVEKIIDDLLKEEVELLICKRVGDNSLVHVILEVLMGGPMPRHMPFESIVTEVHLLLESSGQDVSSDVSRLLNGLAKHPDNLISYEDKQYFLNWCNAKEMLKQKALFGTIKQLCGIKAVRLWNLVVSELGKNNHMLDIHQISEKGLVSIQTARSIMYQLTLKGFTKLYETDSSNTNINQTDRQTLYFTTSLDSSFFQIMRLSYKFASNIIERLVHERGKIFQRNFAMDYKSSSAVGNLDCNTIEMHLLYVIKFIIIMSKL